MKNLGRAEIKHYISAPYRPNQNPTEGLIRELKKKWYQMQAKTGSRDRVSDFGVKYTSKFGNLSYTSLRYVYGRTPLEIITGLIPDIT